MVNGDPWAFLPIFLAGEDPGFVDLAPATMEHGGQTWGEMQWTRDKDFGATPVREHVARRDRRRRIAA